MAKNNKNKPKKVVFAASGTLNTIERELLENFVVEKYLKGYSYRWIGDACGDEFDRKLSQTTVGRYVNKAIDRWRAERVGKLDDMKTVELQRINQLEATYWDAWERSKAGATKIIEKQSLQPTKVVNSQGELTEGKAMQETAKQFDTLETYGDPRFLNGIQWCIQMRCRILGVEAPLEFKTAMTTEIKRTTIYQTSIRKKPIKH